MLQPPNYQSRRRWHPAFERPPAAKRSRIAQLVEQLTVNQRVPGSSPGSGAISQLTAERIRGGCLQTVLAAVSQPLLERRAHRRVPIDERLSCDRR